MAYALFNTLLELNAPSILCDVNQICFQVLLDLPRGPKHSLRVYDLQLRDNVRGLRREAAARRPYSFERGHDLLVCFRVERVVVVRF